MFNPRDLYQEFVKAVKKGELWKVINAGGVAMYIIVQNGTEVASCYPEQLDGMLEWWNTSGAEV